MQAGADAIKAPKAMVKDVNFISGVWFCFDVFCLKSREKSFYDLKGTLSNKKHNIFHLFRYIVEKNTNPYDTYGTYVRWLNTIVSYYVYFSILA